MAKLKDFVKAQAGQFVDSAINGVLGNIFGPKGAEQGFNVQNLISSIDASGIARTSHFEVFVFGNDGNTERDMSFRIESIDLPGRNFILTDHKFTNIGPFNRMPTGQTYSDVTATILLSEDMREKAYFEKWQSRMIDTGSGEEKQPPKTERVFNEYSMEEENVIVPSKVNENYVLSRFGHKYFDTYIGKVEIRQYGAAGDLRSVHILNEAYPTMIAPISMTWGSEDVARLQVTFSYKNYKAVFYRQDQAERGFGFSFSFGKGGLKLGANLPGIGNISYAKGAGIGGNFSPITKKVASFFK